MIDRLTIIRHMLSVIGEGGVSTEDSLHPSVMTAKQILDTEDLDFQSPGWWFNREYGMRLVQDNHGEVIVPATALSMTITGIQNQAVHDKGRYVRRGNRVYDAVQHTTKLNKPVTVDLILRLEITDLPAVASSFLMHRAAYSMYVNDDGDQYKTDKLRERVTEAWQRLRAAEMKALAVNALDNPVAQSLRVAGLAGSYNPLYIGGRVR